jgi:enhancer of mRNA-decapping protein 3
MSMRGDAVAESSAFDETDDAGSNVAMPPTPYALPSFSGKRSRRGKANLNKGYEQRSLGLTAQDAPVQKNVVVSPGMFGGPIAQAASACATGPIQPGIVGADKRRRQRRRQRRNDGHSNAEEEGWATEDVNDYKEREFDFQGNLDRFDKKTVFSQIKVYAPRLENLSLHHKMVLCVEY